jgi:hypothetical protein
MKAKRYILLMIGGLVLLCGLAVITNRSQAQDGERGEIGNSSRSDTSTSSAQAVSAHSDYIPLQGQLTDADSNLLNGTYDLTFRLYDVSSGGTALCEDTKNVTVRDGLFNSYIHADSCPIDGRSLYLSIQVESDPEMTPRQYIDNVPYAWSLRPGAEVKETSSDPIFSAQNNGTGSAIIGRSVNAAEEAVGIEGTSLNGAGVKGYGLTGIGVVGDSFSGPAIKATGTGIIQSTATSTVWISGNGVRKFHESDSTVIDMNTTGGAQIERGAVASNKNVMLPITIPGQLYGQDVTVTDMNIYWVGDTDFDAITAVLLRKQTGVCPTCYQTIIHDGTDRTCHDDLEPDGCVIHYNLTSNNVLDDGSGILYLTIEMGFSGSSTPIDIGGVRLTLAHE